MSDQRTHQRTIGIDLDPGSIGDRPSHGSGSNDLVAQVERLIASAPAGAESVEVLVIRATFRLATAPPEPVGGHDEMQRGQRPDDEETEPHEFDLPAVQLVHAYVRSHGDDARKLKDWAELFFRIGPSGRELTRAVKAGLLDHVIKPTGRDSGALLVHPADLVAYLDERERKIATDDPPDEWKQVLGTRVRNAA